MGARKPRNSAVLDGIRVVELGTVITAPLCAMMLADLGADVVKVERPEGDPFRRAGAPSYSPNFTAYNRNKRSAVIDLAKPGGRTALDGLLATADVFIDNMRPAALDRLGLGWAGLHGRNPRLVHCSITGFGAQGPYRERPAFDGVAQALSGIAGLFTDPAEPASQGPTISDNVSGMYAAYGILGALMERTRTGVGRRLEVSMLDASMAFIQDGFATYLQRDAVPGRFSRVAASQSYSLLCGDGKLVAIHLSVLDKFWQQLCSVLGEPDLAEDARFAAYADRSRQYAVIQGVLAERMLRRPRAEWMQLFERVDVPFAPIYGLDDVVADPHVAATQTVGTFTHPVEGTKRVVHCPVLVDGARPYAQMRPAPLLGEHTDEILPGGR